MGPEDGPTAAGAASLTGAVEAAKLGVEPDDLLGGADLAGAAGHLDFDLAGGASFFEDLAGEAGFGTGFFEDFTLVHSPSDSADLEVAAEGVDLAGNLETLGETSAGLGADLGAGLGAGLEDFLNFEEEPEPAGC